MAAITIMYLCQLGREKKKQKKKLDFYHKDISLFHSPWAVSEAVEPEEKDNRIMWLVSKSFEELTSSWIFVSFHRKYIYLF